MGEWYRQWKDEILEHKYLILFSLILLTIAIILYNVSGNYADKKASVAVSDLILDNIPTLDLDFLFIWGYVTVLGVMLFYPLLFKVGKLHIVISQFSLLVLVRSFFTALTHLSTPLGALAYSPPYFFSILDFKNTLFFSGHTAAPFLGFLLFRKEKVGIFFLIATVVLATTVLFMHVHYSIDVFAALFITYGTYKIGEWLFSKINHY